MASTSGGGPIGPLNRNFPGLTETFGAVTTLLLMGKNGSALPEDPFIVGESVEEWAGPVERSNIEGYGTKYVVRTRNQAQVEKLLQLNTLKDGTEVSVILHPKFNTSRCVISTYSLISMEEKEILNKLTSQGVIDVRRIMKAKKEKTPAIILTFSRAEYPQSVKVGLLQDTTILIHYSALNATSTATQETTALIPALKGVSTVRHNMRRWIHATNLPFASTVRKTIDTLTVNAKYTGRK